ncbi:hypothetical protein [Deinococcus sp.]|uniref:hypothetical protein n=1 Tax=Deinococcus sp. TaxID=47478 RepID=UPI003CC55325
MEITRKHTAQSRQYWLWLSWTPNVPAHWRAVLGSTESGCPHEAGLLIFESPLALLEWLEQHTLSLPAQLTDLP